MTDITQIQNEDDFIQQVAEGNIDPDESVCHAQIENENPEDCSELNFSDDTISLEDEDSEDLLQGQLGFPNSLYY